MRIGGHAVIRARFPVEEMAPAPGVVIELLEIHVMVFGIEDDRVGVAVLDAALIDHHQPPSPAGDFRSVVVAGVG